jgi:hypothetical protein
MANATETLSAEPVPPHVDVAVNCTYVYSKQDGCYHRQGTNPNCPALVCGVGATILQLLQPDTVTAAAPVCLSCAPMDSEAEWCARALHQLLIDTASSATFWKRVSIGLGVLSGLLAIGLVIALVYR